MNKRWFTALSAAVLVGLSCLGAGSLPAEADNAANTPIKINASSQAKVLEVTVTWTGAAPPKYTSEYKNGSVRIIINNAVLQGDSQLINLNGTNVREALINQVDDNTVMINLRAKQDPRIKQFNLKPANGANGIKYVVNTDLPIAKPAENTDKAAASADPETKAKAEADAKKAAEAKKAADAKAKAEADAKKAAEAKKLYRKFRKQSL